MAIANTVIQIKKSTATGNVPVSLANGELAINAADGKLFYKDTTGTIKNITNQLTFGTVNANGSLVIASTTTDTLQLIPGNNINITANTTSKSITVNVKNNLNVQTLNVTSGATFSGGDFIIDNSSGIGGSQEGGEIKLATAAAGSTLAAGTVSIDIYQNKIRIFETNGSNRGVYIDLANGAQSSVGTNLISTGAASGVSSVGGQTGGISNNQILSFVQAVSATNSITFDYVATANNGQGTNFKIGDDAWIGDINVADTMGVKGQQNSNNGYIAFGPNDGYKLGRVGFGPLTYNGILSISNTTVSTSTSSGALVVSGGVGISGALNATTKSFNIPHPTKKGKSLRYGSLEGPEFGVYVRGVLKNSNVIELPEYWTKLVDVDSITVSLTPVGDYQKLFVKEIKDNCIYVANDGIFGKNINCHYVVYAERADTDKLVVES